MHKYRVYGTCNGVTDNLGTFETGFELPNLYDILMQVFNPDKQYVLHYYEVSSNHFKHVFYVHKWLDDRYNNAICIGQFETNLDLAQVYDIIFQIFHSTNEHESICIRKQKMIRR
jgi:hypothetical protein